jgi:hypothetical protein
MAKFASRQLTVLVNVNLFDEGLDLPGVECVIMGRPSMSLGKIRQQEGRPIRPVYAPGFDLTTREGRIAAIAAGPKPFAIMIDHVEAYKQHKFPDTERIWSLIRQDITRKSKNRDDELPLRSCEACFQPYEAVKPCCPHCGHKPVPTERGRPEAVMGDIVEFSPELIAALSGEVARVDGPPQVPQGVSEIVKRSIEKRWRERQEAQTSLRHAIAVWAGEGRDAGKSDQEMYRTFFVRYGVDVLTAKSLGATEANDLRDKISPPMNLPGVT